MQSLYKPFFRFATGQILEALEKHHSTLVLGPRQVGKTWLLEDCLRNRQPILRVPLQLPEVRQEYERDPSLLRRRVLSMKTHPIVFIDEAQKVLPLFDAVQSIIDEKAATILLSGSSARKLRRKSANLLPGRVLNCRLDPLMWSESGILKECTIPEIAMPVVQLTDQYSFSDSMIFGSLPGIAAIPDENDRAQFLKSYTQIYLEEEIRAEALSRNIGAFSRFLELAAAESGGAPNYHKLSMESGVSAPTIKQYFSVLEDTLVIEIVEPYLKNARKRILETPKYYFFDIGVRNSLARLPLTEDLVRLQKGILFEHATILEIIRRVRALRKDYRVCYWRTSSGLEVDCVIDCGSTVIPIEIKSARHVALSDLRGLRTFLSDYQDRAPMGYVITNGEHPEKLCENITALPWWMM